MSLLKKLAGETALYGLSSIVGRLLNYLLVPLYAHTLTKVDNGVLNELYSYAGFLMVVYTYRLESAFFRYGTAPQERRSAYATGLLSLLTTTAVITLVVLLLSPTLAGWLQYDKHPEYIAYFALILALDALAELPFARLRMEQRPRRFVTARLLNISLNIFFTLFWLLFCPWAAEQGWDWVRKVWSPDVGVAYVFRANLLASAATILFLLPQMGLRLQGSREEAKNQVLDQEEPLAKKSLWQEFDWGLWRRMMLYAAPLIVVQFAGIANQMLDRVLLKWLLPGSPEANLAEVGVYGNNYKLAMLITIFTQAYRYAAEPFFFRHAQDKDAPVLQAKVTKWFTIVATLGMLAVLLSLELVKEILGPAYYSGLKVVPILLLANVLLGLYYNLSVWYRLKDKTMLGAAISLIGAGLTVALNFVLVPRLGFVGAAWTALATYGFICLATWLTGLRYYPVPYAFGRMAFYIGLALALYAGSVFLKGMVGVGLVFWRGNAVGMGVFLGITYFLEKGDLKPQTSSSQPNSGATTSRNPAATR